VVTPSTRLSAREPRLGTKDSRDWRLLILLVVLVSHMTIVWLLLWPERQPITTAKSHEALVLLLLPNSVHKTPKVKLSLPAAPLSSEHPLNVAPKHENATEVPPEAIAPKIDWDKEAEMAIRNAIENADRQNNYRNLAALSPEQLRWVRENHFEPAPSGIQWKYRRVEISEGGFPIIHINDHCVIIPLMMMMVFCKIGHIESNGTLFDHMRDVPTHGPSN
jgi:hypothetical protein